MPARFHHSVLLLVLALLLAIGGLALARSEFASASVSVDSELYLPMVHKDPNPTPIPPPPVLSNVYVNNQTGGNLCYEIQDAGIGERCFSSGAHHYGDISVGTHSWRASANCGSASGSQYYGAGYEEHEFWCGNRASAARLQHAD